MDVGLSLRYPLPLAATAGDADAMAWIANGANADPVKATNAVRALKAVGFTSSNAFADIKAAGGIIQFYRGLNAGGATIPDLTGNAVATPVASPPFNTATGYTLNGNNQYINSGYMAVQGARYFGVLFGKHVTFSANDGLFSDLDATTSAISVIQRTSGGNRFRSTVTRTTGTTSLRDSAADYLTGIDYQMGILLAGGFMTPFSNVVSAEAFVADGPAASLAGEMMRAADGTIKLGRAGSGYGNIEVHAFVCAPLAPTAAQLQNLVDAMEVFWS